MTHTQPIALPHTDHRVAAGVIEEELEAGATMIDALDVAVKMINDVRAAHTRIQDHTPAALDRDIEPRPDSPPTTAAAAR